MRNHLYSAQSTIRQSRRPVEVSILSCHNDIGKSSYAIIPIDTRDNVVDAISTTSLLRQIIPVRAINHSPFDRAREG
jgi:hypothetical protein